MPSYELLLAIRKLPKPEMTECLKRAANFVLSNNAVLRKIENLGLQSLHVKISNSIPNAKRYTEAHYFLYHLDTSPEIMRKLREDCVRDNDMIRTYYVKKRSSIPDGYECTLEDEFRPPALRPSVQSLIEEGRKQKPIYDIGEPNARQIS